MEEEKKENQINKFANLHQITDNILLGNIIGLSNSDRLLKLGVTHVLSCCDPYFGVPKDLTQKVISIADMNDVNIMKYFKQAISFIETAGIVYVHCMAGVSRSASFVIAYLMWKLKVNFQEAFQYVKNKRPVIYPNFGFVQQLKLFDKLLQENDWDLEKIDLENIKWKYSFDSTAYSVK